MGFKVGPRGYTRATSRRQVDEVTSDKDYIFHGRTQQVTELLIIDHFYVTVASFNLMLSRFAIFSFKLTTVTNQ